ncbi:MAG TPA: YcxB family protein [Verrucomicrobiae bacterium]
MSIKYTLESGDLRALYEYSRKRLPHLRRIRYVAFTLCACWCVWVAMTIDDSRLWFRALYFCIMFGIVLAAIWTIAFILKHILLWRFFTPDKYKSVLCEHTLTLADDALINVTPLKEDRNRWEGIYQVVDASKYIYIFTTIHSAVIIPKRAFSDAGSIAQFYERATKLHTDATKETA